MGKRVLWRRLKRLESDRARWRCIGIGRVRRERSNFWALTCAFGTSPARLDGAPEAGEYDRASVREQASRGWSSREGDRVALRACVRSSAALTRRRSRGWLHGSWGDALVPLGRGCRSQDRYQMAGGGAMARNACVAAVRVATIAREGAWRARTMRGLGCTVLVLH